jgi:hypothetical protein
MITFMLGVLGSTIFWVVYGIISFLAPLVFVKIFPHGDLNGFSIKVLQDSHRHSPGDRSLAIFMFMGFMVIWPMAAVVGIVYLFWTVIRTILFWTLSHLVKITAPRIPSIKVEVKKE